MKALLLAIVGLVFSGDALAQRYQDWNTSRDSDSDVIAADTTNDSGGSFGLICYISSQNCYWALLVDPDCENGASYPVMANTDAGAQSMVLTCLHVGRAGKDKLMVFQDFEAMSDLAKLGSRVGFAIPMKDGLFRVMRFSLLGAHAASTQAREMTVREGGKSTRDLSL